MRVFGCGLFNSLYGMIKVSTSTKTTNANPLDLSVIVIENDEDNWKYNKIILIHVVPIFKGKQAHITYEA